jgi:prepilin-type processing-associated H-X9-DG protein
MGYFAPVVTRGDYAANQGDGITSEFYPFPPTLDLTGFTFPISNMGETAPNQNPPAATGINFYNAFLRIIDVKDGLAHTYMVGEKYLNSDHYLDGQDGADDWCMLSGAQNDINRLCANDPSGYYVPSRDRRGFSNQYPFGSAHASSFNMVMCDGSAQSIRYDIDMVLHSRLGNRADRKPTDMTGL